MRPDLDPWAHVSARQRRLASSMSDNTTSASGNVSARAMPIPLSRYRYRGFAGRTDQPSANAESRVRRSATRDQYLFDQEAPIRKPLRRPDAAHAKRCRSSRRTSSARSSHQARGQHKLQFVSGDSRRPHNNASASSRIVGAMPVVDARDNVVVIQRRKSATVATRRRVSTHRQQSRPSSSENSAFSRPT
jgi:hypothetical protein